VERLLIQYIVFSVIYGVTLSFTVVRLFFMEILTSRDTCNTFCDVTQALYNPVFPDLAPDFSNVEYFKAAVRKKHV
jgi:hypothetical protein